jgi:hypothetical protein
VLHSSSYHKTVATGKAQVGGYGDSLEILLNGCIVKLTTAVPPSEGHIFLQSELSECWIRRWELKPLSE